MEIEAAPMAGYTDFAFRRTLIKCGAKVVWTEMVSAAALFYGNKKTLELLKFDKIDGVKTVVQIFGKDPRHFEFAIKSGHLDGFCEININMGCPANKIIKNGEGAALAQKPDLVRDIVRACVRASGESCKLPISVKMRLDNVHEIAKICEEEGACRIIIHGRTREQGYSGAADWAAIENVVKSVKVPVIANGDVKTHADAVRCVEMTGAAGVMMGRALIGSPWKIARENYTPEQIRGVIEYHLEQAKVLETNPNEMKKHELLYAKYL